ncbi:hypothetical protein ACFPN0_14990 [Kitasatospora cinereorecta]
MTQITDQTSGVDSALPSAPVRVLGLVAAHFVDERPADVLLAEDLLVAVGAEAYMLCGRSVLGGSAEVAAAALDLLPSPYAGITRGEFALWLLAVLSRFGYVWAEDDNQRAIPSIPQPRIGTPVPRQPTPAERSVSTAGGQA